MQLPARLIANCVFALWLPLPCLAVAQSPALKSVTPEQRAYALTQMMMHVLSLDDTTTAAVSGINLEYALKIQALMESAGPQVQKINAFRKNVGIRDAQLKVLFTPQQFSEYLEKKSEIETLGGKKLREKLELTHHIP